MSSSSVKSMDQHLDTSEPAHNGEGLVVDWLHVIYACGQVHSNSLLHNQMPLLKKKMVQDRDRSSP